MSFDLPALVRAEKILAAPPAWAERGPDAIDFSASLEVEGITIEGLSLRGRTRKSVIDREVIFQLEYHRAQIIGGAICRIEWRPINGHNNKGLGPKEFQHILQTGSHHHRFDLNWARSPDAVLRGELPIAVPIENEPTSFRALLALVGKEFRIKKIQSVAVPPWQPSML
jgi:hypothetical protein